ncbi:MAG: hypothetical protein ISQ11_03925 [Planctomycetes bacterium]|nr:hypothetical protein [Planctomycetota bacterium]
MTCLAVLAPGLGVDAAQGLTWFSQLAALTPAAGVVAGALAGGEREASTPPSLLQSRGVRLIVAAAAMGSAVACSPAGAAFSGLPGRGPALAVLCGLFLLGVALSPAQLELAGRLRAAIGRAALLVLIGWCADGAAAGWGILRPIPPWSPGVTSWLLDLSPRTLLMEGAGLDWMRHPAMYEAAGTDRLGPGLRTVYAGPVAGSTTLLVGCAALAGRALIRRSAVQR